MPRWSPLLVCLTIVACAGEQKPKQPYVLPLTRPASSKAGSEAPTQPPDLIAMTVRENRRGLNRCQAKFPEAVGEIDLSFFVDDTGRATNMRIDLNELKSPQMTSCVAKFIESLTFPQPVRGAVQSYHAHFRPDDLDREAFYE